jgi:hypothetical protein
MSTLVLPRTQTPASDTDAHYAAQQGDMLNAAFVVAQIDRFLSPLRDRDAVASPGAIAHDRAQRSSRYTAPKWS